jgi:tetratricopeptide (TPR) repeat protein
MAGPPLPERDLAVLRSFARRIDPSDAGAHNNLGVLYYQKGLVPEAIGAFGRALELDPRMQVAQRNLEIAYRESGFYDRQVSELHERLRREPDLREARWELGRAFASLGHHDQAVQEFETLLARHPDDVPTIIQLGLAEKARGRLELASAWFQRATELDARSSVARFYLGEALYNRGLNDQALAELRQAVALNPEYADAHYLLAFVYGDLGRHEEARRASRRAVELNPTLARAQANLDLTARRGRRDPRAEAPRPEVVEGKALAHFTLGLAFRQKGYHLEALREYRLALDAGEDQRLVLQAMAEVHLLRRDHAAALELYDRLVAQHPDSPKLWNERAVCLHQAGRSDEARDGYARAAALEAGYALAWNNLGVLLAQREDSDGATDAFRTALEANGRLIVARLNLALLLLQHRRLQPALEAYRQVLAVRPDHPAAWNGIGLVLMELGRHEDARNAFARAVDCDPAFAPAHYNLSFTLSHLGDFDGALRETKRALELEPYYVPQKYQLTIDLQFEDPTIAVAPDLSADVPSATVAEGFTVDEGVLDDLFATLASPAVTDGAAVAEDPLALARDYVSKGLLELATAEVNRARGRGAAPAEAAAVLGDVFARRGLHGEALERYREARALSPDARDPALGELRALLAVGRSAEAAPLGEALVTRFGHDAEALEVAARVRLDAGNPVGALDLLHTALRTAPGRADLLELQARISARLGDLDGAVEACRAALALDQARVQGWLTLGRLEEARERWNPAREAYAQALDLLPTYSEAALALADLLRRRESPRAAITVLVDLLGADPYDLDALVLLARTLVQDGRPDRGLEATERVLRFAEGHPGALFVRGEAFAALRRLEDATSTWEALVRSEPTSSWAAEARSRLRSARDLLHILSGTGP